MWCFKFSIDRTGQRVQCFEEVSNKITVNTTYRLTESCYQHRAANVRKRGELAIPPLSEIYKKISLLTRSTCNVTSIQTTTLLDIPYGTINNSSNDMFRFDSIRRSGTKFEKCMRMTVSCVEVTCPI